MSQLVEKARQQLREAVLAAMDQAVAAGDIHEKGEIGHRTPS